jgi:hypothetical protein
MVAVRAGASIMRSAPVRSSSSTLLSGRIARPKPASARRFCAVRLSIGTISAAPSPLAASSCRSAIVYRSAGAPGGGGKASHRCPASAAARSVPPDVRGWPGGHTGTSRSWWMTSDTRPGWGSAPYRSPRSASPRSTSALTSALSAVRSRRSRPGCAWRSPLSRAVRLPLARVPTSASVTVPRPVPRTALTASIPSRIEASSACACGRKARPASVRATPRPSRSNSGAPSSASSSLMRRLAAGWDRCKAADPRANPPLRTMARNAST